ncbi:MAG: VOC family protein [Chloroflexi bacterium]|nr:VOC family protein [Chloroflexota bacterium]
MSTVSIDHIAMPTANAERLIEFYKRLGFTINDEEEWRSGTANIFSIQVGDSKINVHPEGYVAGLRGPTAIPGCGDICFVWEGTVEECQEWLAEAGVEVILGPSPRKGGRDFGRAPSLSLYARDPDDNLLEWMTYL